LIASQINRLSKATFMVALSFLALACEDRQARLQEEALTFVTGWFQQAADGVRDDALCHGLGTLKHPEITCREMLEHASRITASSRQVTRLDSRDCFGGVCGEFVEIGFNSQDTAGNELRETALLKRDEGRFRMYWYRSDSLLALLRPAQGSDDEQQQDPLQLAYDEITARYPPLYEFPPCYDSRASSANLVGELMAKDAIDVAAVEALAAECGESFCFALVGNKIATLCPASP
jgi:hypothetical protein